MGRQLRLLGALEGDAAALREAVALLDGTSARLERAKAHAELGEPVHQPTRLRRKPVEEFAALDTFDGTPL